MLECRLGQSARHGRAIREWCQLQTLVDVSAPGRGFVAQRGIERIHILKLDTEGHEFRYLQGATRLLEARAIDFFQFEFGGTYIDLAELR
jgi:hypothetical protein